MKEVNLNVKEFYKQEILEIVEKLEDEKALRTLYIQAKLKTKKGLAA